MSLKMPKFKTESEEADWWYANRKKVERELREAERSGKTLKIDDIIREQRAKNATKPVSIRISQGDLDLAKRRADAKGIGYQTYIRMLLHEALQKAG